MTSVCLGKYIFTNLVPIVEEYAKPWINKEVLMYLLTHFVKFNDEGEEESGYGLDIDSIEWTIEEHHQQGDTTYLRDLRTLSINVPTGYVLSEIIRDLARTVQVVQMDIQQVILVYREDSCGVESEHRVRLSAPLSAVDIIIGIGKFNRKYDEHTNNPLTFYQAYDGSQVAVETVHVQDVVIESVSEDTLTIEVKMTGLYGH